MAASQRLSRSRSTLSFRDRWPASEKASKAAQGASKKVDTQPELILRRALWSLGLRYQKNVDDLAGKPDLAFRGARVAVFCDGDFWHGRSWKRRKAKLSAGNNSTYWVAKIERNMQRDFLNTLRLERAGWRVVRLWEGDIKSDLDGCILQIRRALTGGVEPDSG